MLIRKRTLSFTHLSSSHDYIWMHWHSKVIGMHLWLERSHALRLKSTCIIVIFEEGEGGWGWASDMYTASPLLSKKERDRLCALCALRVRSCSWETLNIGKDACARASVDEASARGWLNRLASPNMIGSDHNRSRLYSDSKEVTHFPHLIYLFWEFITGQKELLRSIILAFSMLNSRFRS